MKIDLAEASELTIKTSTNSTKLIAEELPTVSLKGRVLVASLEEDFADDTNVSELDLPEPKMMPVTQQKPVLHHAPLQKRDLLRPVALKSIPKPANISTAEKQEVLEEAENEEIESSYVRVTLVTISTALACLLIVVFFAESSVEASVTSYDWSIHFSTDSLTALLALFSY